MRKNIKIESIPRFLWYKAMDNKWKYISNNNKQNYPISKFYIEKFKHSYRSESTHKN